MKRVQVSVISLVALAACQADFTPMWQQIDHIESECLADRHAGKLKTAVEYTDCMEQASMPLYVKYQYPYTDVMQRYYLKHRVISEKLDKKKISKAEANSMVSDLKMETTDRVQQNLDRQHQRDREFIQDMQQIQRNTEASRPIHCDSYSNYGHTRTTCN